ncbi:hypothetical protein [Arthrobacter sp. HMWF013]|uniref:hypothetical protein n=1 Tax=Arthrobacter sp. HMWF013 TaxID=2056849 RepID=UPI0011B1D0FC|nr:hypothetical protein [Arthrobacter sp. HMWF013]
MNRLTSLFIATGAGLALALTASPAMAAPPSSPDHNGAYVEHRELSFPNGTYENRSVTQHHGGDYYTTISRDQWTYQSINGQSSLEVNAQYTELENVLKLSSQTTASKEDGTTCRSNSLYVIANGDTRMVHDPVC